MKDVVFGLSQQFAPDSNGIRTSVAVNRSGNTLEVHQSQSLDTLWCRVGHTRQLDTRWNGSSKYDSGIDPSVCLNDHNVAIEVHSSENWSKLWYHVGTVSESKVDWGSSHKYDSGMLPSIALDNDNWCVEAHSSEGAATGLWYRLGKVDAGKKTINWVTGSNKYGKGYRPRVAMNNQGVVVEVHNNEVTHNALWYTVGILDKQSNTIHWGESKSYGNGGTQPSVAITDDGFVIEVHKSEGHGTLWRHVGTVNTQNKTIDWSGSAYFDDGQEPSVACASDGSIAIQTHQSENSSSLWYATSLIADRSRWMETLYDRLQDRPLWRITIPGSHDAGAYNMQTNRTPCGDAPSWLPGAVVRLFAETHTLDLGGQLDNGIRFFDLRPYVDKQGKFYAYHDVIGASFETMLDQIATFLKYTRKEFVILKISHFCSFTDERHKELVSLIDAKIGEYLYKGSDGALLTTPFGQLVSQGSRCAVWYDATLKPFPDSFYRNICMYDDYANSEDYETMRKDQLKKMKENPGTESRLFLLSWTLTFSEFSDIEKGLTLHVISKKANRHLGEFLATEAGGYQVNIVYVDFPEDARATDCVIALNR